MYEQAAKLTKAISHPLRMHVVASLLTGRKTVSELLEGVDVSQPNISQHLAKMRGAGVVVSARKGRVVYCSLADSGIKKVVRVIAREWGGS